MLYNGYGEHNIQGIGDKHIPLIHNVMNTDVVIGVSDQGTDGLNQLFGSNAGRSYLSGRRKLTPDVIDSFEDVGISGLANILAAIELAKHLDYGARMYASERKSYLACRYPDGFDEVDAAEIFARHVDGAADDHVLELRHADRKRIFNLGYFTWVEQQGVTATDFDRRRDQAFWRSLAASIARWDDLIRDFTGRQVSTRA